MHNRNGTIVSRGYFAGHYIFRKRKPLFAGYLDSKTVLNQVGKNIHASWMQNSLLTQMFPILARP